MTTNTEQSVQLSNIGPISAPRRTTIDELGNTFQVEFRGSLTTVTLTLPNGLTARGNARLYEGDVYNKRFGEELATIRATQRVLRKYERWLSREGFRLGDIS